MSKSGGTFTDLKNAQTDANGTPLYGIDKELAEKAASKYDPALEADCRSWLEVVTGTVLPPQPPTAAAAASQALTAPPPGPPP